MHFAKNLRTFFLGNSAKFDGNLAEKFGIVWDRVISKLLDVRGPESACKVLRARSPFLAPRIRNDAWIVVLIEEHLLPRALLQHSLRRQAHDL